MYPVGILGVSCLDPNFGIIELFFMANMGFFGVETVEKSFLTFIGTSEYVFYLHSFCIQCIRHVFYLDSNNINVSQLLFWLENQLISSCILG